MTTPNTTVRTDIDEIIPLIIYPAARDAAEFGAPLPQIIQPYDISGKPGKSLSIPKWAALADAIEVDEGEDYGDFEKMTTTESTFTPTKKKKGVIVTDEAIEDANEDVLKRAGRKIGISVARKDDKDAIALFTGVTTHTQGGTTSALTASMFMDGITDLEMQPVDDLNELKFAHSPKVLNVLKKELLQNSNYGVWQPLIDSELARKFRMGEFLGVKCVPDGHIAYTSYAVGCMWHDEAFGRVKKSALTIVKERKESADCWILYGKQRYVYGEVEDGYAVKFTNQ